MIIDCMKKLLLGTILVKGIPRHSESNKGIERFIHTIEERLKAWIQEYLCTT